MDTASYGMNCQFNHEIPMRDGVILRGNLYTPEGHGPWPVLLLRSVFRKDHLSRAFSQYDPAFFVKHGYAVYMQDVRGLGASDGEFDRFTADGPDGYDTIEYLAAQPWCTGRVGMMGSYYAGYLQMMAAAENPPHLSAIVPMQTSVSINRDCDNRGFMFFSHIGWNMSRLCNRLMDGRYPKDITAEWLPKLQAWLKDYPQSQLSVWPARNMPVLQHTPFSQIKAYFRHLVEGYDNFELLHKEGRDMDVSKLRTPAFYIAGWYDSSRTPLLDHCMAQRKAGVDSRVLIAPWHGADQPARPDGALESGVSSVDLQDELLQWFDHWLKDAPTPKTAPVRYYNITDGSAYAGEVWPPEKQEIQILYLSSHGLLASQPDEQGADTCRHDPKVPLPFRSYGRNTIHRDCKDDRILCYLSEPLAKPLTLSGLPKAQIYLSSTARDADVMLSLCEEAPDGTTFAICDGATRARYRDGWEPKPLENGEIVALDILLGHVEYTIPAGHRLFIQLSNSAFPKYDVNHGTAARPADDADWVVSTQTIHFGGDCPSAVMLPVLSQ